MSMIQNSFGGPTQSMFNPAPTGQYPPMPNFGQMPQMSPMGMPQGMGMGAPPMSGSPPPSGPSPGSFQGMNPQYGPQSNPGGQSIQGPQPSVGPNQNPGGVSGMPPTYGMGGMGMGRTPMGSPPGYAQFQNWQQQRNQQRDGLTAQPATGLNSPTGQPFNFPTSPTRFNNTSGMPPMGAQNSFGGPTQQRPPQNFMPPTMGAAGGSGAQQQMSPGPVAATGSQSQPGSPSPQQGGNPAGFWGANGLTFAQASQIANWQGRSPSNAGTLPPGMTAPEGYDPKTGQSSGMHWVPQSTTPAGPPTGQQLQQQQRIAPGPLGSQMQFNSQGGLGGTPAGLFANAGPSQPPWQQPNTGGGTMQVSNPQLGQQISGTGNFYNGNQRFTPGAGMGAFGPGGQSLSGPQSVGAAQGWSPQGQQFTNPLGNQMAFRQQLANQAG